MINKIMLRWKKKSVNEFFNKNFDICHSHVLSKKTMNFYFICLFLPFDDNLFYISIKD